MINEFNKQTVVLPSQCDASAHLGLKDTFALFMDVSLQHSQLMGVDSETLLAQSNALWVAVHIKVRFFERPCMLREIEAGTWPSQPVGIRCDRNYVIKKDGRVLVDGRAEWTMIDADSRKIRRLNSTCYPQDLDYKADKPFADSYRKGKDDFTEQELAATRIVRPTDIDMAQHTNNVVYCRMLLDTLPVSYYKEHKISEIEINFRHESREGEQLKIYRRERAGGWDFVMKNADGTVVVFAWISVAA